MTNTVFIATSLDGYIADKKGGLDWLDTVPNPDHQDFGFASFMENVDALVMGRHTFEVVCGFDIPWPYNKPTFVVSDTLGAIPEKFRDHAELITGTPTEIVTTLNQRGLQNLYIDGGVTIQRFLQQDLIDELIITRLPILLGDGVPMFGNLSASQQFTHISTQVFLDALVQSYYRRQR
ncbi:dihydrofolate reductase [Corallincola luteus]|uniref:Dihydrofolate reductase n=1 Tax=Corallincola luteus TaxID=1775177 RepID=A0ABY2ANN4_9GAMM|nr:dihydrofolate reductase family protein [Corallincola luteus]TCI04509.1 dihydrofolate reductase [Corallincola luteus]